MAKVQGFAKTLVAALVVSVMASHAHSAGGADEYKNLREGLTEAVPGVPIEAIRPTPVKDVFEVFAGGDIFYATADGKYIFSGILFETKTRNNLTEARRDEVRAKGAAKIKDEDLVIYKAKGEEKTFITVFTDPSCPFCQKLHKEIPALNEAGVTVKYALYARAGSKSDVGTTVKSAFCSENQHSSVDEIMNGVSYQQADGCDSASILRLEKLAKEIGVTGTPFIFTAEGKSIPGYKPAAEMLKELGV